MQKSKNSFEIALIFTVFLFSSNTFSICNLLLQKKSSIKTFKPSKIYMIGTEIDGEQFDNRRVVGDFLTEQFFPLLSEHLPPISAYEWARLHQNPTIEFITNFFFVRGNKYISIQERKTVAYNLLRLFEALEIEHQNPGLVYKLGTHTKSITSQIKEARVKNNQTNVELMRNKTLYSLLSYFSTYYPTLEAMGLRRGEAAEVTILAIRQNLYRQKLDAIAVIYSFIQADALRTRSHGYTHRFNFDKFSEFTMKKYYELVSNRKIPNYRNLSYDSFIKAKELILNHNLRPGELHSMLIQFYNMETAHRKVNHPIDKLVLEMINHSLNNAGNSLF